MGLNRADGAKTNLGNRSFCSKLEEEERDRDYYGQVGYPFNLDHNCVASGGGVWRRIHRARNWSGALRRSKFSIFRRTGQA